MGASRSKVKPNVNTSVQNNNTSNSLQINSVPESSPNIAIATTTSIQDKNEIEVAKLSVSLTPRREQCFQSKIMNTPCGDQINMYRYYCPLCMSYFQDILKSKCCGNYTCVECCTAFLNKRDTKIITVSEILSYAPYEHICCPHCNTIKFHPSLLQPGDQIREYFDKLSDSDISTDKSHKITNNNITMHSPLKIGDSYEDLKRKMIYHSNSRQIESDSQNQNNSVSNSVNNDGFENVRNRLLSMTPPSSRPSSANNRKVIPLTSIGINDSSGNERVESETNGMSNVSSAHTAAKNYVLNLLNIATSTNHGDNIYSSSSIPNTSVNENVAISNGSGNVMVTGIALSSRKSSRNEHNHISLSDAMLSQE